MGNKRINKYLLTTKAWKTEKMTDVNLSKGEYELIMMMANNKEFTLEDMLRKIYPDNEYMKDDYQSMRLRLYRLRKKRI